MIAKKIFLFLLLYGTFLFANDSNAYVEHEFVIIVPSYNNKGWYKKNLDSIFAQTYDNYRIIYIDDASTDGTARLVEEYVKAHNQEDKFTLIRNTKRLQPLANRYRAIHTCPNHAIIAELDGDDWFAHPRVLERLNAEYQNPEVWLTYGKNKQEPFSRFGIPVVQVPDEIIQKNQFREMLDCPAQLRSYYVWLFKQVKLKDLLYKDSYFPRATDWAVMFPMLEMAGTHSSFIGEELYIHNKFNPINMSKVNSVPKDDIWGVIRNRAKYTPLAGPVFHTYTKKRADFILLCTKGEAALLKTLASIRKNCTNIGSVYVYEEKNCSDEFKNKMAHQVIFMRDATTRNHTFSQIFLKTLEKTNHNYLIFGSDGLEFTAPVDVSNCINLLNTTGAYGFYFHIGLDNKQFAPVDFNEDVYAWDFAHLNGLWGNILNFNMTLYRKNDCKLQFLYKNYQALSDFDHFWKKHYTISQKFNLRNIGLCFQEKIVTS